MKNALIFSKYWQGLGGGEEHLLYLIDWLAKNNYKVEIAWHDEGMLKKAEARFGKKYSNNIFISPQFLQLGFIGRILKTRKFDLVINYSDGSSFFSLAKKNIIFALVPQKSLFPNDLITKIKNWNWEFITNSDFSAKNITKYIGKKVEVVFSPIEQKYLENCSRKKEKIILNVGRFFPHLHSKRQDVAISAFIKLKQISAAKDFQLVLIGGLQNEEKDYFQKLQKLAGERDDIKFLPNASFEEMINYFAKASFYWHCAGWGVDEEKNPQLAEHFGIAPLEAMACGCATLVYENGGPAEIVKKYGGGMIYQSEEELINKTLSLINDEKLFSEASKQANQMVQNNFSYQVFEKKMEKLFTN